MKVDGVFAGGGVRAFTFIGVLEEMESQGYTFERLAGTSAGAIIAALIKAGFTSKELRDVLEPLDLSTFMDKTNKLLPFRFIQWIGVYYRLGLYKGDKLEEWLEEILRQKGIRTFEDLPKGSLKIIASDLTRGRILVLPDDLKEYGMIPEKFSVARAIRMSCSIPYFFQPVKLYNTMKDKSIIVDGGVLSNFPMWVFMEDEKMKLKRPVIGFRLTPELDEIPANKITNAFDMFHSLFETMRKAHDVRYISKHHAANIVFIPFDEVKATNFLLNDKEKEALIAIGREHTRAFLKKWRY
ncbi:patatin-like phospholipase family protein [Bacillus sp. FJAT-45350]|uniref:patatin-like phospholipase family protein n=1 Tax=Bacillus sp. FJAT-45350 TaxID=2011014 RepID=UPI000BB94314|nr:patatin-like phospholipase family protein [Bacillus sp. FJAT-45350]